MRVDLTGAYTDIAPVTDAHCSTTVSAAVAYFARVTATRRYDGKFAVYRDGKLVGHFSSKSSGAERDLVSVAAAALGPPGGVSVNVRLDLPPRSGLGTSAAVVVAVTRALVALSGKAVEKAPLAEAAAALERDAGIAGGKQDQYASVFGGVNAIEFAPTRLPRVVQLGEQASRLTETMLIAHCGGGRDSQDLVEAVMHA
jgi:D-glycero-alpha-D-manno-heptose-7-phosphate kinase